METQCDGTMTIGRGNWRKVRGFQPPWRTVIDHTCPKCGAVVTLNANWRGSPPPGAIRCTASSKPLRAEG